jgi:chemotaxis signal transduction protein
MSDDRATALRAQFDRAFADPPRATAPATRDYLRIRIDGEPHALVLTEIASLHTDLHVVRVPTPAPELLGVAAVRAALVPIYDLRVALGASATAVARWVVLVRGATVGFAFDGFDGHARAEHRDEQAVTKTIAFGGRAHPLVSLREVLGAIETRWLTSVDRRVAIKEA